jgi:hypothetical protein
MRHELAMIACLFLPALAAAQTPSPRLPRSDVSAAIGWSGTEYRELEEYNRWNAQLLGGLGAGHYWTDQLKTEVEAGWLSRVSSDSYENLLIDGVQTYAISTYRIQAFKVSLGQTYQFGRNAWSHPFVGAGVDLDHVRSTETRPAQSRPILGVNRPAEVLVPALREVETTMRARPFVKTGVKLYVTDRAFFTTDLKLGLGNGVDHVLWRTGIGVDF